MINAITATLLKNSAYSNKNKNRAHLRKAKFEKLDGLSDNHPILVAILNTRWWFSVVAVWAIISYSWNLITIPPAATN